MPIVHRNNDKRYCDGTTEVIGQTTVFAGGELISVVGDPIKDHKKGKFKDNGRKVLIGGKRIIAKEDLADGDDAGHPSPDTRAKTGISTIIVG